MKLYAREAEVFAGYTAYTDHEVGRVIQEVQDEGKLDNTMISDVGGIRSQLHHIIDIAPQPSDVFNEQVLEHYVLKRGIAKRPLQAPVLIL